jgi:hypothetical protein
MGGSKKSYIMMEFIKPRLMNSSLRKDFFINMNRKIIDS